MESPSHTILVVDDETRILSFARHILEIQGFRVLTAKNGMEALLFGERHPGPIHALITDLKMPPYRRACELARAMRRRRRGLAVLFISGYPPDDLVRREMMQGMADFLAKPFTPDVLVRCLRELILLPGVPRHWEPAGKAARAILLMVPDDSLRKGIAALFRVEGLQVLESRNFGETLIICQWHVGYIGLLLAERDSLDRLPPELLERLGQVRPEMRILRASSPRGDGEPAHERVRRLLDEWGLEGER